MVLCRSALLLCHVGPHGWGSDARGCGAITHSEVGAEGVEKLSVRINN